MNLSFVGDPRSKSLWPNAPMKLNIELWEWLQVTCDKQTVMYCGNKSAMHIVANLVFHEMTKHLKIDCHVVREKMQVSLMRLLHISTHDQTANIFTKGLHPSNFQKLISKVSMIDIYHSELEGECYNFVFSVY